MRPTLSTLSEQREISTHIPPQFFRSRAVFVKNLFLYLQPFRPLFVLTVQFIFIGLFVDTCSWKHIHLSCVLINLLNGTYLLIL